MNISAALKRVGRNGYVEGIGRMMVVVLLTTTLLMSTLAASEAMEEADAMALEASLTLNLWIVEVSVFTPMVWVAISWAMLPIVRQIGSDFEAELNRFNHRHLIAAVCISLVADVVISRGLVLPYIMGVLML